MTKFSENIITYFKSKNIEFNTNIVGGLPVLYRGGRSGYMLKGGKLISKKIAEQFLIECELVERTCDGKG